MARMPFQKDRTVVQVSDRVFEAKALTFGIPELSVEPEPVLRSLSLDFDVEVKGDFWKEQIGITPFGSMYIVAYGVNDMMLCAGFEIRNTL